MKVSEKYGSLTATQKLHKNKRGEYLWEFLCDCGNTHVAVGTVVKRQAKIKANPKVPSCGCENVAVATKRATIHGASRHPLYEVLKGMKARCYNKNNDRYEAYGGAGVTICDEWLNDPGEFVKWALANGWKPGLQLDKDILCDKLNITPKIYAPHVCQFISQEMNTQHSASRETARTDSKRIVISAKKADKIRAVYRTGNVTQRALAIRHSVSQNTICRIVNRP